MAALGCRYFDLFISDDGKNALGTEVFNLESNKFCPDSSSVCY